MTHTHTQHTWQLSMYVHCVSFPIIRGRGQPGVKAWRIWSRHWRHRLRFRIEATQIQCPSAHSTNMSWSHPFIDSWISMVHLSRLGWLWFWLWGGLRLRFVELPPRVGRFQRQSCRSSGEAPESLTSHASVRKLGGSERMLWECANYLELHRSMVRGHILSLFCFFYHFHSLGGTVALLGSLRLRCQNLSRQGTWSP